MKLKANELLLTWTHIVVVFLETVTEMQVGDIYVSAPGKAILHGEHAVVHGKVTGGQR